MAMGFGTGTVTTTQQDFFATYVSSSIPAAYTPVHEIVVQNNGAGTIRLGDNGVSASQGYRLVPGDVFRIRLTGGNRLFAISESGSATGISVLVVLE